MALKVDPFQLEGTAHCTAQWQGPASLSMAAASHSQAGPSRTHLPPLEPAVPQQSSHIRVPSQTVLHAQEDEDAAAAGEAEDSCLICLTSPIADRSILPNCSHSLFCFRCIITWIQVSSASYKGKIRQGSPSGGALGDEASASSAREREREREECSWGRCPLCNRGIGRYILHAVRRGRKGDVNWERWWLRRGEHTSGHGREDEEVQRAARRSILEERRRRRQRQEGSTTRNSSRDTTGRQADLDFARQIAHRRQIYSHGRYAKVSCSTGGTQPSRYSRSDLTSLSSSQHLGSNPTTGLGPAPSPSSIRAKPHLLSPALPSFLRRELLALPLWSSPASSSSSSTSTPDPTSGMATPTMTSTALDVPFLTTYLLSLLQHLDVRSEGFVKLLGEVLGDGHWERQLAEHFSHELCLFLRLGARGSVKRFDALASYEVGEEAERVEKRDERRTGDEVGSSGKRRRESPEPGPSLSVNSSSDEASRHRKARDPPSLASAKARTQVLKDHPKPIQHPERANLSPSPSPSISNLSTSSSSSVSPAAHPQREEIIAKRAHLLHRLASTSASATTMTEQSDIERERALKAQLLLAAQTRVPSRAQPSLEPELVLEPGPGPGPVPVGVGGNASHTGSTCATASAVRAGSGSGSCISTSTRQREEELKRSLLAARVVAAARKAQPQPQAMGKVVATVAMDEQEGSGADLVE